MRAAQAERIAIYEREYAPAGKAAAKGGYEVGARSEGAGRGAAAAAAGTPRPPMAAPPRTPFMREVAVLFKRTLTEILRNPALLMMHCVTSAVVGLFCGGIFWKLDTTNVGAQNRLGAVFFPLVFMALTSLTTVDLLCNERGLVIKEVLGGYYRPVSYYLSKATLDGLLLRVIPSLLFSIPFYPMSGFQTAPQLVATFFGVLAVFSAAVGALSMAVTVMFGSAGRASLVMNLVVLVSLLFAGLLVNVGALAPWVAWVPYLSTVYYGFQALVVNEFTGLNLTISAEGASLPISGVTFLHALRVETSNVLRNVAVLDALWLGFFLLGIGLLYATLPRPLVVHKHKLGAARRAAPGAKPEPGHESSEDDF